MIQQSLLALALVLTTSISFAEGLTVTPGLWETKMTRTDPVSGNPVTNINKQCVEQTEFDPAEMMKGMQGCKMLQNDLAGNKLDFKMQCDASGTSSTVEGSYQVDGDQGKGSMSISMNVMGQAMNMSMNWESKRLGDCE